MLQLLLFIQWKSMGSKITLDLTNLLEFVSCVSCVPASCFLIWFVSCHYWLIRVQVCVICECVFKSCLLNSISSGLLVIPGVSTLPCLPLMLSLKTIILKYFLVCVFLVSPCCGHRNRRPDQTVSVVPSPRFVLFVFSSVLFVPEFCPSCSRFAGVYAAVRGSPIPRFAGLHARRSREFTPPFAALPSRGSREFTPSFAALPSSGSREFTPPFAALPSRCSRLSHPAVRGSSRRRSRLSHPAVRGSCRRRSRELSPPFAGVHAAVRGSTSPQFPGDDATIHG